MDEKGTASKNLEQPTDDGELEDEDEESGKGKVKVLGMEMTESCEMGAKWSRPPTPQNRTPVPQNIYIASPLVASSKLLVSDSHTETLPTEDHAVVLTGKVTLSLIGLDKEEEDLYTDVKEGEINNRKLDGNSKLKINDKTCQGFANCDNDGNYSESDEFESDIEECPTPKLLHN